MRSRSVKSRVLSLVSVLALALTIALVMQLAGPPGAALADEDLTCEIDIDKTNNTGGAVDEGDDFIWTLHVSIDEDCTNIDFVVRDNIPSGFDVISFDDDGLDCDANSDDGDIDCSADEVDGLETWNIRVGVEANGEVCGNRTNTAVIESPDANDRSDSNTVDVDCDLATIKIIKDTNPETTSPSFSFEISRVGGGFSDDFSLDDDESVTFHVSAGIYIVEEDGEDDWELVDIDCSGSGSVSDDSAGDGDVRIEVDENDSVTCTFTNEREDEPRLILIQPPQVIFPTATPRPPTPVATVLAVTAAPQLPRAGEGLRQGDGGNGLLPIGAGLLVFAVVGLTYWRFSRAR